MTDDKYRNTIDDATDRMMRSQYPDWDQWNESEKNDIIEGEIEVSRSQAYHSLNYAFPEYKVHRIVIEDILIDPDNPPEGGVDRSLSIPLSGDIRSVWAPNGYGKTFAFKILRLLASKSVKDASNNSLYLYFNDFFMLCANEINSEAKITNLIPSHFISFSNQNKKLIPFSRMYIRLVESNNHEVVDISVIPNWNPKPGESMVNEILRKFWNPLSLEGPFLKKNPDSDLEEIFGLNISSNPGPIIEPNFLRSSFIFPKTVLEFRNPFEDSELPELTPDYLPIDFRDNIATEITVMIKFIMVESESFHNGSEVGVVFEQNEIDTLEKISAFLSSKNGWDNLEKHIRNGEELLLGLLELSRKYKNLLIHSDNKLMNTITKAEIDGISRAWNIEDTLFDYIFALFDSYLHDFNPPNSNYGRDLIPFDEMEEEDWKNFEAKEFATSKVFSMPWRLFPQYSDSAINIAREMEPYMIEESGMPMFWEESCFANALKNLHLRYFEIPSIINYSSEEKLNRSQGDMTELLYFFRNNYNTLKKNMGDERFLYNGNSSDESWDDTYHLLSYIKTTLGDRDDTLNSFLSPLTGFDNWQELFSHMESSNSSRTSSSPPPMKWSHSPFPNLLNPAFSRILEQILGFVEIIDNINDSLNSEEAESWAALCRFDSWRNPMKFSDSKIGYDIQPRHLSFGQCSVIALEVCIGAGLLIPQNLDQIDDESPHIWDGKKFKPRPIQSCIILDEPEIGRSEHWVNKISERIFDLLDDIEKPLSGNIYDQSFTIVSHRESLLRSLSSTNSYYVMQPVFPRISFSNDTGEEE